MFSKHDLHEAMKLKLGDVPWAEPFTPQQMRAGMARAMYGSPLIRQINNVAEREGWSGEDKYTALAFYTTLQLEILEDIAFRRVELEPMPPFFTKTIDGHPTACDPVLRDERGYTYTGSITPEPMPIRRRDV